jgi:hypothetical protein
MARPYSCQPHRCPDGYLQYFTSGQGMPRPDNALTMIVLAHAETQTPILVAFLRYALFFYM